MTDVSTIKCGSVISVSKKSDFEKSVTATGERFNLENYAKIGRCFVVRKLNGYLFVVYGLCSRTIEDTQTVVI